MLKLIDKLLGKGISFTFLAELLFYNTAWIIALAAPMAILVAAILSYGKFSSNNEVVGFYASGIKPSQALRPTILTTCIICMMMIYFNCEVLPNMNIKARQLNYSLIKQRPDVEFEEGIYSDAIPNHLIIFNKRDKYDSQKFHDVLIHQISSNLLKRSIIADSVKMKKIKDEDENLTLNLYNGTIYERIKSNEEFREINFGNYELFIPLIKSYNNRGYFIKNDRELTYNMLNHGIDSLQNKISLINTKINKRLQLFDIDTTVNINHQQLVDILDDKKTTVLAGLETESSKKIYKIKSKANKTIISGYIKNIERNKNKINRYKVELHKKLSIPVASLVFILIGAPLGIKLRRGNLSISMAISLLFFVIYYVLIVGGEQLADRNKIDPSFSMWLPNIIVLLFGYFTIKKMK